MIKHTLALALSLTTLALPVSAFAATQVVEVSTGQGATNSNDILWKRNNVAAWVPNTIHPNWLPAGSLNSNGDGARWVTPNGNSTHSPNQFSIYTAIFSLPNFAQLASTVLSGKYWSDNGIASILLNGNAIFTNPVCTNAACDTPAALAALGNSQLFGVSGGTAFGTTGGFVSGDNTLTFKLWNGSGTSGNPEGLRVLARVVAPVPEPGTWMLMLLGFGAIGFAMRSRAKTQVRFQFA